MDTNWFVDQARLGKMFSACNQAGATVTLINTSTTTGYCLSNSLGSGRKLVLYNAIFTYTTVPTAVANVFLAQSINPSNVDVVHTTPVGVYNVDGSGVSTNAAGKVDSSCTTPVLPVYTRQIGYSPTTPATTGGLTFESLIRGTIILVPGTFIQISYITTAPVGITSMSWVEVPA